MSRVFSHPYCVQPHSCNKLQQRLDGILTKVFCVTLQEADLPCLFPLAPGGEPRAEHGRRHAHF